ncbi:MAG: hypothetical protein ACI9BF_000242 [Candidatus Paceibacteria bacterium]|jgi:hypothetical protein
MSNLVKRLHTEDGSGLFLGFPAARQVDPV